MFGLNRLQNLRAACGVLSVVIMGFQSFVVHAAEEQKTQNTASAESSASASMTYMFATDLTKSKVLWKGSKVIGDSHEGDLMVKSGQITFEQDKPSKAEVVMDMSTINCTDMKGRSKKKIEAHLKDPDFFDVKNHPTATLKVSSFKPIKDSRYEVSGDITIRGITKPLTFLAKVTSSQMMVKGSGSFTFNRAEFDVKYNSTKFFKSLGDKAIKDDVELSFVFETQTSS